MDKTKNRNPLEAPVVTHKVVLNTAVTTIILLAGVYVILRISKEMLKELEGMGF